MSGSDEHHGHLDGEDDTDSAAAAATVDDDKYGSDNIANDVDVDDHDDYDSTQQLHFLIVGGLY